MRKGGDFGKFTRIPSHDLSQFLGCSNRLPGYLRRKPQVPKMVERKIETGKPYWKALYLGHKKHIRMISSFTFFP